MSVKKTYYKVAEPLTWQAVYSDDTVINELEKDTKNKHYNLDPSLLEEFRLLNDLGETILTVTVDPDKRIFYRMRNKLGIGNRTIERHYMVGWRDGNGRTRFWIVYPDGSIKFYNGFHEKKALLSEPHWHPNEVIGEI